MNLNTLTSFFKKAVNRPIEGVIKADDSASLKLEVDEYVLTDEVEKRLETFLEAYNNYEGANGVWISGFFGSGKSHLLKMLAILLENRIVDGEKVADLFIPKCSEGNDFLRADINKAVKIPSQSILFNIDQKADVISKTETDALVAVFVKVFDEACGYYGKQAYIAQFERELDRDGLLKSFKEAFKSTSGQDWEFGRERAKRYANEIDKAYNTVTKQNESNILDKHRTDYHLAINDFADQVKEYIDKQVPNFRLNFFVDEVGQYIANNEKLMVNLQTVAESLNTKCRGKAWVIVTAQNDMSRVLGEMENRLNSDDYTKIQDRFKIRMNLTSADVAEVIQKRLLAKNIDAEKELATLYKKESDNFKTLFDFADGSQTYKNFQNEKHFIDCYPFIPYQFTLFQSAIQNLSMHDAFEGRYSSVGERSMLGVFQHVAVGVSENSIGELATFDMMFEGIRTSLKTGIQSSILKAEDNLDNKFAVKVLKALFLIKYIKEFKGTLRNICVLMYSNFNENLAELTKRVQEALNLLEQEIYIQRMGETYEYLTDEEKDIEKEIKNTDIDRDDVATELQKLIFDRVLIDNKIRYGEDGRNYPYSRKLDDKLFSREQELGINIISPLNDNTNAFDDGYVKMFSIQKDKDLIIVLQSDSRLVNDLGLYKKTNKFINETRNMQQQESIKKILNEKAIQNAERYNEIQQRVSDIVGQAKFYIKGSEVEISGEHAQSRIIRAFQELVSRTYTNLKMLCGNTYKEEDIASFLDTKQRSLFATEAVSLSEAEQDMLGFISTNITYRTTVKSVLEKYEKIPYGWSYPAILCNLAKLCARGKIEIKEDSNLLDDADIEKALRSTQRQPNLILQSRMEFSPSQMRALKEFYGDFANEPTSETDAKALAVATGDLLKTKASEIEKLLYKESEYPFLKVLQPAFEKIKNCCGKPYTWYLIEFRDMQDELLNIKDNIVEPVARFMTGIGREIYSDTKLFIQSQEANFQYLSSDDVQEVKDILKDENCFKGNTIQLLKEKLENIKTLIETKLQEEKENAKRQLDIVKQMLISMDEYNILTDDKKAIIERAFENCKDKISSQKLIAVVKNAIENFKDNEYKSLLANITVWAKPKEEVKPIEETSNETTFVDKPIIEQQKIEQPVSAKEISTSYQKPLIQTEADVEEYVNSLKDAYLRQIKDGKKIQL